MRQLITNDVFQMSRILKKLDIKMEVNVDKKDKNWDEKLGVQLLTKIAENAHLAQTEINDFMGGLTGITGKEFGELPIKESAKILKEFRELDGIADFFKRVGQLRK